MTGVRPYQGEDLLSIRDHYLRGKRRLLGVAATGLGKTVLFSNIHQVIPKKKKILLIVNREILIGQSKAAIEKYNPDLIVGVEQAGNRHSWMDDVVIVSVQTVGSTKEDEDGDPVFNKRLLSLDPDEFDIIICDEAHRALAKTWIQVLKYFKVYKGDPDYNDPEKLLLCLTATPNRADNKGLEEICEDIAFVRDIRWGIENKWLTDIEAYRVNTRIDISDVKVTKGDLDKKQLAKKINIPERNKLVVEKYKEIADGKKALFFTVDIQHAKDLADELNKQGVSALPMYSGMSEEDRAYAMEAHRTGRITALTNAMMLTEGYDDPSVEVICVVKPTKSRVVYTQIIGRGLRPFPSPEALATFQKSGQEPKWIKPACIVIDFVDVSSKHTLCTVPTLFGLSSALDLKGKKALKTLQEIEAQVEKLPQVKQSMAKIDQFDDLGKLTAHIEKVDLLSVPSTPPEIQKASELSWISIGEGYSLSTPEVTISIQPNTLGNYSVYSTKNGLQAYVGSKGDFNGALKMAEGQLDDNQYQFAKASSTWKTDKPSMEQASLLSRLDRSGVKMFPSKEKYIDHVMANFTKGQVSDMISERISGKKTYGG